MGRRIRYLLNRLANALEDGAERLVGWLRAKAERKHRPRPLVFPSAIWLALMEAQERMVRQQAAAFVKDLEFWRDGKSWKIDKRDASRPFIPLTLRDGVQHTATWPNEYPEEPYVD